MAKIIVNNPKQVINGGAKKYYFKVKGLGGLKGDKGDKGDTGAQGLQGIQGLSATVHIGTTTTGEPGTQASVRNSGTESNAVLDFTIPRGDVGSQPELVQTTGASTTEAMSQNATTEALNNISETKQDKLTAGDNIKIENGVISSTDTTYTAGNGLNLNGTEFSADTNILATKSGLDSYYTKTETDTKLAPKLETEVVTELPTTGEEGKLYLTPKANTTQTATGNPITATVEEAGKIESFQLDGDTFQQSYTGKNLLKFVPSASGLNGLTVNYDEASGIVRVSGTPTKKWANIDSTTKTMSLKAGSYILSVDNPSPLYRLNFRIYDTTAEGGYLDFHGVDGGNYVKFTLNYDINDVIMRVYIDNNYDMTAVDWSFKIMLESGSDITLPYEPYVGGVPSPNPDYPQPIQTVTGLQTIRINGTDYPLDLGNIQLCRLGTYQDYIWKDGEDWKIHKETDFATIDSLSDGSSHSLFVSSKNTTRVVINQCLNGQAANIQAAQQASVPYRFNRFIPKSVYSSDVIGAFVDVNSDLTKNGFVFRALKTEIGTTDAEVEAWLNTHPLEVHYVLATPTDTVITDQTLIAQLEAIRTASLQNGANTITNTAIGSNLAGNMEIGYYGYNPRNRYDKWLWLDINNEYEKIGS